MAHHYNINIRFKNVISITLCAKLSTQKLIVLYSLNTLSGVTSERCPSPRLCAKAHTSRLQRWRVVGMCGRFDRLGIWTPYLPHQKRTSSTLKYVEGSHPLKGAG